MKLDALIKWFMPKEERFHELLAQDTANLLAGAHRFSAFAYAADLEDRRLKLIELKDLEHKGDALTRQIFDALNSTFITPFDREDLSSIANDLDDILDYLEGVGQYMVILELDASPEGLRQFADILVEMAEEIARLTAMIWDLANESRIRESVVRVSDLENRADDLYNTVIADLFRGHGHDPIEILKWKEVYDGLEDACDQCKDYSHVIGNVVIKNN